LNSGGLGVNARCIAGAIYIAGVALLALGYKAVGCVCIGVWSSISLVDFTLLSIRDCKHIPNRNIIGLLLSLLVSLLLIISSFSWSILEWLFPLMGIVILMSFAELFGKIFIIWERFQKRKSHTVKGTEKDRLNDSI
jgi:hypothetical protein